MFESMERFGDRPCLILDGSTSVSYRELIRLTTGFREQLGRKRKLILLEVKNNLPSVVAIVACFRGNQPFILCSDATRARIEAAFHPDVRVDFDGCITSYTESTSHRLHPDLAVLLSTSGSTGATKLVRLSESAMASNAAAIVDYLNIGTDERAITSLPISYSYGLSVLTSHLSAGASLVLSEDSVVDEAFWNLFSSAQVTSLAGVPYTYELLETTGFRDRILPSLRYMTQAGGRLSPELVRRYATWGVERGVRFFTMYGQTEAAPRMAYLPAEQAISHADCIGRAIPGGRLRVVSPSGDLTAKNTTGELVYTGPNVMMGYAKAPDDLARGHEVSELRTGDLAQEIEDGLFRIVGRSSRFCKIIGLRIDLDDTERLLLDRGHEAAVVGNDELIAVCVVGDTACIPAVTAFLDQYLHISRQSRIVFVLPRIPRFASGKIDYQNVLAAGIAMRDAEARSRIARFQGRNSIASDYGRILHLDDLDGSETFSSLGGDSLSYVELSVAIERRLGHLPLKWEHLTIDEIDSLLSRQNKSLTAASAHIGTEIALRAAAIAFIVAHHTLMMDLGGGMEALLLLLGLNLARSQTWLLVSSARRKAVVDIGMRLVLPYYIILSGFALRHHDHVSWLLWFSLGNWASLHSSFSIYWFIPAYIQVLLLVFALAGIAPIRRLMIDRSGTFAALFLAAALLVKVGAFAVFHHFSLHGRTPDQFIYVVALGWCLHEAKTVPARLALVLVAAGIALADWSGVVSTVWSGFDGRWRNESLLACVIVLAFVPSIRVPLVLRRLITSIAVASLTIYLTHPLLLTLTAGWFSTPRKSNPACYVAVAGFLSFGVMVYRIGGFFRHRSLRFERRFKTYVQGRRIAV